jgi:hypothetical protein
VSEVCNPAPRWNPQTGRLTEENSAQDYTVNFARSAGQFSYTGMDGRVIRQGAFGAPGANDGIESKVQD